MLLLVHGQFVQAQSDSPIPVLALISAEDAGVGQVLIRGEAGAVLARDQVAVRNLLTGATAYATADVQGAFSVTLSGTPGLAYQINRAASIPLDQRQQSGPLPGDGAVLLYQTQTHAFETAGLLARGASGWVASGRIETLEYAAGDRLNLRLDARLSLNETALSLPLGLQGALTLLPLTDSSGQQQALDGQLTGWSGSQTAAGLPIANMPLQSWPLGQATRSSLRQAEGALLARLTFSRPLPDELPDGLYALSFSGLAQVADSDVFDWYENRIFSTLGTGEAGTSQTLLPLLLRVGDLPEATLQVALFDGLLPVDGAVAALDGLRFAPERAVLPPAVYALEPQIRWPFELPLNLTGSEISAEITRPDGQRQILGALQLQAASLEDAAHSRRLRTLDPRFDYAFEQYGDYDVRFSLRLLDATGRVYQGGGLYQLTIAETMPMLPDLLPGTPLVPGDVVSLGAWLPFDADLTTRLRVDALDSEEPVFAEGPGLYRFEQPGAYRIDYDARFEDANGRLWVARLRSAGLIADPDSTLILRGRRGPADYTRARQAWYDMRVYPPDAPGLPPVLNFPYYSGDVAYVPDGPNAGMRPVLQLQDTGGAYAALLRDLQPEFVSPLGDLESLIRQDELPILYLPQAPYLSFITATRPDILLRQVVVAQADSGPDWRWDNDERFGEQIGAGLNGNRVGDFVFLFGGLLGPDSSSAYASLAIVDDSAARVTPPFEAPLFQGPDGPIELFFHPTSLRPGQIYTQGDTILLAGQFGPTIAAELEATLTSPSGQTYALRGMANPYGYLSVADVTPRLDEVGVWQVAIQGRAGRITGTVPGTQGQPYQIYVLPADAPPLPSSLPDPIDELIQVGQPLNINALVPDGWTEISLSYSLTTPSGVLSQGVPPSVGASIRYTYDAAALSRRVPSFEGNLRAAGPAASDAVSLTLVAQGLDAEGRAVIRARRYLLLHDRYLSLEATP